MRLQGWILRINHTNSTFLPLSNLLLVFTPVWASRHWRHRNLLIYSAQVGLLGNNSWWKGWRWHPERWMEDTQLNCLTFFNCWLVGFGILWELYLLGSSSQLMWQQAHLLSKSKKVLWEVLLWWQVWGLGLSYKWLAKVHYDLQIILLYIHYPTNICGLEQRWFTVSSPSRWGNKKILLLNLVHKAPWETCPWTPLRSLDIVALNASGLVPPLSLPWEESIWK